MSKRQVQPESDRQPENYEVGYGKPPATFRFKKGVSGNPKGRPPGRRNSKSGKARNPKAPKTSLPALETTNSSE